MSAVVPFLVATLFLGVGWLLATRCQGWEPHHWQCSGMAVVCCTCQVCGVQRCEGMG